MHATSHLRPKSWSRVGLLAGILSVLAGSAWAQTYTGVITGTITEYSHPAYATVSSQFRIDNAKAGGQTLFGGVVNLFCGDYAGTSLDQDYASYPAPTSTLVIGEIQELTVWARYSTVQNEPLAIAQLHWAILEFGPASGISTVSGDLRGPSI